MMMDLEKTSLTDQSQILPRRISDFVAYANKANRREAEQELMACLGDRLAQQRNRLGGLELRLAARDRLTAIAEVDRVLLRVQLLIEDLRAIGAEHHAWFEADALPEDDLETLYRCDLSLLSGVDALAEAIGELSLAVDGEESLAARTGDLVDLLDLLNERLGRRRKAIQILSR
ncbi:MAG: hypothetical protein HY675_24510 [Chloroflexi bacterium]|nr:hypothetical protein [Chloroflexota bacterium]